MRFTNNYKDKIKKIVEDKNLTYYIDTMGCSMNENDSSKYAGILESIGFKREENEEKANLILFNTCCIRENAENTLFGRLGTLKKYKMNNENVYIVVVGCMTQQKHIIEKIKKSYRFVDITLGTGAMNSFPSKLYDLLKEKKKNIEFVEVTNEIEEEVPIKYDSKYKASVSIIYGCNNFCSYCIVPYVRGRERSRRPEDILNDVRKLAKEGYKEIMLLGQNVNSYGNDFKDTNYSFPNLLQDIEKIDGIEIIRFMSPHPKDFSDELIDVIKSSKKIARQIHLPLQSGSSKILKEMNRKHTKEDYLKIVNKLKNADENISISLDELDKKIEQTNEFEFLKMNAITDDEASAKFLIDKSKIKNIIGREPIVHTKSGMYVVIQTDLDNIQDVKLALESYGSEYEEQWKTYLPDQYELVKNREIGVKGNYVYMIVSESPEKILELIK